MSDFWDHKSTSPYRNAQSTALSAGVAAPQASTFRKLGTICTELGFYLTTSLCLWIGIPSPSCLSFSPWLPLTVPHPNAGFQSPSTSVLSCTRACRIAWLTPFWIPQTLDSLFWVSPSLDNSVTVILIAKPLLFLAKWTCGVSIGVLTEVSEGRSDFHEQMKVSSISLIALWPLPNHRTVCRVAQSHASGVEI